MADRKPVGRPPTHPLELRDRAVKMVWEVRAQAGQKQGSIARVARELG